MSNYLNLETDFRRWILFNPDLSDFQNLYDLHTAVRTRQTKGAFTLRVESEGGENRCIIEQQGNESSLVLVGEADCKLFIDYLHQHYFPAENIETWYKNKRESKDKSINHLGPEQTSTNYRLPRIEDVPPHPKESRYYNFRVFFSALAYVALLGYVISLFAFSVTAGMVALVMLGGVVLLFTIMGRVAHGLFIGVMKGASVKINDNQYPELFEIVSSQAKAIGLKEIPEVYVAYGEFNAFVTRLARRKYLMLYSQVVETALQGDYEVLKFVVGHELGHIKRRHLSNEMWLLPSLIIPFLRKAHSRACEYTCDRIGYHFSSRGAVEGVLIMSTGKEIHSRINVNRFIEDAAADTSIWIWLSEKFLAHPHISKRLRAIRDYGQRGY